MTSMSRREMLRVTSLSAAGVALGIAGCGGGSGSSSSELRMTWWGDPTRDKVIREAIDLFVRGHRGVEITRESAPWNGYWDRLATQVAGRAAADWLMMDQSYLGEYAQRGALADLGPYVGSALDLSGMAKGLVDSTRIDGKLYVVPLALNTQIMLYDATALQSLGIVSPTGDLSWDEFATFAGTVSKASGGKLSGSADMGGDAGTFEVWLRSRGTELYAADGKSLGCSTDDISAWWSYWLAMQKSGGAVSAEEQAAMNAGTDADDVMIKKRAAVTFNWSPSWQNFEQLTTQQIAGRMLPFGSSGSGQFTKAACYFASPANSKQTELAAKIATFLVNDPGATKALGLKLGVPVTQNAQKSIGAAAKGSARQTVELIETVQRRARPQSRPWPKGTGEVAETLKRIYEEVSFGRTGLDSAVGRMFDEANHALQQ